MKRENIHKQTAKIALVSTQKTIFILTFLTCKFKKQFTRTKNTNFLWGNIQTSDN